MSKPPRVHERWAHLRFSVVGHLLAAPPDKGELRPGEFPPKPVAVPELPASPADEQAGDGATH